MAKKIKQKTSIWHISINGVWYYTATYTNNADGTITFVSNGKTITGKVGSMFLES